MLEAGVVEQTIRPPVSQLLLVLAAQVAVVLVGLILFLHMLPLVPQGLLILEVVEVGALEEQAQAQAAQVSSS
jgi:hypothetical protein